MYDEDFMKMLLATFKEEAKEFIEIMTTGIISIENGLEKNEEDKVLETIYRTAHNLKGSARAVNITEIEDLIQSLETLFKMMKHREITFSKQLFTSILEAIDYVNETLFNNINNNNDEITKKIKEIIKLNEEHGNIKPEKTEKKQIKKTDSITKKPSVKKDKDKDKEKEKEKDKDKEKEKEKSDNLDIKKKNVNLKTVEEKSENKKDNLKEEQINKKEINKIQEDFIRISTKRLDNILNESEELILVKLKLNEYVQHINNLIIELGKMKDKNKKTNSLLNDFYKNKESNKNKFETSYLNLKNNINEHAILQETIVGKVKHFKNNVINDKNFFDLLINNHLEELKKTILISFSTLINMFPKNVRDIANSLGKKVKFQISGGDIEVDKRIIEQLKDPLVHIIRNAIDHGIEFPDERIKKNKPEYGNLFLKINQKESDKVEIIIEDDGGGINLEKLKEKALKMGILNINDSNNIEKEKLLNLIFHSEITTSSIVTEFSGRGLGMAIVKENLEKLGGKIKIETKENVGTKFFITIPVTLSTFRGIIIEISDEQFVIPTLNVDCVVRIKPEEIKTIKNKDTVKIFNKIYSLVNLGSVLNVKKNSLNLSKRYFSAVILTSGNDSVAFIVDNILDEQEVVVKTLGSQLKKVKNISGVTILGNGKIAPILNTHDLIDSVLNKNVYYSQISKNISSLKKKEKRKKILVVDDSLTTRMLLKNVLESEGYDVKLGNNGKMGFDLVKSEYFDAVVTDVEMPQLSGFQLTEKIRKELNLTEIPIIIITSLGSKEDMEKGIAAGASAYIVKRDFDQSNLLDLIERFTND